MAKLNEVLKENEDLKKEMANMISIIKENEILAENFKKLQYKLLLARNFDEISENALKYAEEVFNVEKVAIFVHDASFDFINDHPLENNRVFIAPTESFDYTFLETRPFFGKDPIIINEKFRVYQNTAGYSFVIVPIILGEKISGAIAFYSSDVERFNKERDFAFLNETAFLAGICLKGINDSYRIEKRSQKDYLTGLPNKSVMDKNIHVWLESYKNFGASFSFVISDLDNFSYINQNFSHKTGDEFLKRVSKIISRIISDNGMVGRLGGDVFYMLLNAEDEEKLTYITDGITKEINEIAQNLDIIGKIGISGGGVRVPHDLRKADSLDELLKLAFLRLAKAKKEGRGIFIGV